MCCFAYCGVWEPWLGDAWDTCANNMDRIILFAFLISQSSSYYYYHGLFPAAVTADVHWWLLPTRRVHDCAQLVNTAFPPTSLPLWMMPPSTRTATTWLLTSPSASVLRDKIARRSTLLLPTSKQMRRRSVGRMALILPVAVPAHGYRRCTVSATRHSTPITPKSTPSARTSMSARSYVLIPTLFLIPLTMRLFITWVFMSARLGWRSCLCIRRPSLGPTFLTATSKRSNLL